MGKLDRSVSSVSALVSDYRIRVILLRASEMNLRLNTPLAIFARKADGRSVDAPEPYIGVAPLPA